MEWLGLLVLITVIGIPFYLIYDYILNLREDRLLSDKKSVDKKSVDEKSADEKLALLEQKVNYLISIKETFDRQRASIKKEREDKITAIEEQEQESKREISAADYVLKKQEQDSKKEIDAASNVLKKQKQDLDNLVNQRVKGFPLLGEVYKDYFEIKGKIAEEELLNKSHPAKRAAEVIKEEKLEKRELIKQLKVLEYKIKNYELIAPFLTEIEEEITPEDDSWILDDYSEEEKQDEVIKYLTKEEYRKLSTRERNQRALDRYWTRHKSKWGIGRMYEHYIGYLYEKDGWEVEYFGIKERYEDFGRDLIAKKGKKCHIVQCKNWSKYRTIYEKHIFQLFGTTYEFQQHNPKLKVTPVFYTSTELSEAAREFAKRLGIELHTNKKLEKYPMIKCNINRKDKSKIYHLPFDQQYDNTIIEPYRNEFYCETVAEAENAGFHRAFRWHKPKEKED